MDGPLAACHGTPPVAIDERRRLGSAAGWEGGGVEAWKGEDAAAAVYATGPKLQQWRPKNQDVVVQASQRRRPDATVVAVCRALAPCRPPMSCQLFARARPVYLPLAASRPRLRYSSTLAVPSVAALLGSSKPFAVAPDDKLSLHGFVRSVRKQKRVAFAAIGDGSSLQTVQAVLTPEQAEGSVSINIRNHQAQSC